MDNWDVIVVGGGHAGCEAAAASARLGASTLLVTMRRDQVGAMSCNPAIGGLGKGHLVREVDAWDGLIARAADAAAIHHRMLNRSRGPAVWGPRIQADRRLFRDEIQRLVLRMCNLDIVEGEVEALEVNGGRVTGVGLSGRIVSARSVVLAAGTFLSGVLRRGETSWLGGRDAERASMRLALQLRDLGLAVTRLKTGTPPRLDGRTIDWARLGRQPSDDEPWTMSSMGDGCRPPQLACAITRTNPRTHDLIRAGMHRSPLRSGAIQGNGPRYCPSIEDKVERFGDRDGHQIFLEPEGLDTPLIYPNGISTSLPAEVQSQLVRSIDGLEQAKITTLGYAVEYDHFDPRGLAPSLMARALPGLFLAGQINGTTGYEEAAAQGLVAGLNAARHALDGQPILFERSESYIGVMIDDLCLQGVTEPYRMLTGRAEYRLRLRADNAGTRLTARAMADGAVGAERADAHRRVTDLRERLAAGGAASVGDSDIVAGVRAELDNDRRYAPYVERQSRDVARLESDAKLRLPGALDYRAIPGLSHEMVQRLERARPETIGAVGRVPGISPSAVSAVLVHAHRAA